MAEVFSQTPKGRGHRARDKQIGTVEIWEVRCRRLALCSSFDTDKLGYQIGRGQTYVRWLDLTDVPPDCPLASMLSQLSISSSPAMQAGVASTWSSLLTESSQRPWQPSAMSSGSPDAILAWRKAKRSCLLRL